MRTTRINRKGFTLIELMIVVVIIGVLAALAIPRFFTVGVKSKQSEAKLVLKQIYANQRAYFQQNDSYWIPPGGLVAHSGNPTAFSPIWIQLMLPARYSYSIVADRISFLATATSSILDDDATLDQWTIDQDGDLQVVVGADDAED